MIAYELFLFRIDIFFIHQLTWVCLSDTSNQLLLHMDEHLDNLFLKFNYYILDELDLLYYDDEAPQSSTMPQFLKVSAIELRF